MPKDVIDHQLNIAIFAFQFTETLVEL